jgi:hypothetical protein
MIFRRDADSPLPPRFKKNVIMDIAERYGEDLRRWLRSAERLIERAMLRGSLPAKTPSSSVMASLLFVTFCDHFFLADAMTALAA